MKTKQIEAAQSPLEVAYTAGYVGERCEYAIGSAEAAEWESGRIDGQSDEAGDDLPDDDGR